MVTKEYFTDKELSCRCGCGVLPSPELIDRLYAVRIEFGRPLVVTSCARCLTYNKKIGGAKLSYHITDYNSSALAVDVQLPNKNMIMDFISIAYRHGFKTQGIIDQTKGILHIDLRDDEIWLIYK